LCKDKKAAELPVSDSDDGAQPPLPRPAERPNLSNIGNLNTRERRNIGTSDNTTLYKKMYKEEDFKIVKLPAKGLGVISTKDIPKGSWVLEYKGTLQTGKAAEVQSKVYDATGPEVGSYMFFFKKDSLKYCIDATKKFSGKGRYLNHSFRAPNLKGKIVVIKNEIKVIFIATRQIKKNDELTYDYGIRSKQALIDYPWLND
jgi:hypothetical protein